MVNSKRGRLVLLGWSEIPGRLVVVHWLEGIDTQGIRTGHTHMTKVVAAGKRGIQSSWVVVMDQL